MENSGRSTFLGICLGGLGAIAAAAVGRPVFHYPAPGV